MQKFTMTTIILIKLKNCLDYQFRIPLKWTIKKSINVLPLSKKSKILIVMETERIKDVDAG